MSTVLLSTAYFPPLSYFKEIFQNNEILIEQHANYAKQTFANRTEIHAANGKLSLTVPVQKFSNTKIKIKDVRIAYDTAWQKQHLRSIESAYRSTPFYEHYMDNLINFFEGKYKFLLDLNIDIIETILSELEIEKDIHLTKLFVEENNFIGNDLRFTIHPKKGINEKFVPYYQVFKEKNGFIPNLSILDLLFNEGPQSTTYL